MIDPHPPRAAGPEPASGSGSGADRGPSRIRLDDPKKLYRLIESVLTGTNGTTGSPTPLERCVEDFLQGFRADLGLRGAILYRQRRATWQRQAWYGEDVAGAPMRLEADDPWVRRALRERVALLAPAEAPTGMGALGLPRRRVAGVLVDEPRARHLLLFVMEDDAPLPVVDFVLHTLRSVLGARVLQTRWHSALTEAAEIQRLLLPARPPRFAGYDVAGTSVAAEEVGGDFFDYVPARSDVLGLAIGDASGHGLPAALVARDVLVGLRMGSEQEMKIAHLLRRLNRVVRWNHLSSSFVSVFYGELEPPGHLVYVNAGQPPPLLVSASGTERLSSEDAVLGPLADIRFTRHFARLAPGDLLVLYTDGIVERLDAQAELFGEERLEAVARAHRQGRAAEVVEAVFDEARRFGHDVPWEDDATVVVVKRLPHG